ncbi:MAG: hypothetical protein ACU0BF_01810 [Paracoccaceae bacterium]
MTRDPDQRAPAEPILARAPDELPAALTRGADVPDDLDPLADGILMAHQATWLADDADLKLAEKGRRTGITFAEALDDTLIAAAARSAGGDNVFYIGDTKDKGREFIGYVAHFAKVIAGELHGIEEFLFKDEQPDGSTRDISAFRITFASGFRVEALSSNPANIRGLQGVVVIDEAAFHRDVRAVIDAVNALLIWGGRVRVISTHNGVLNAFNELVREARAGANPFSVHHIPFGLAVENGLYRRVCYVKGREWSQAGQDEWEALIRGSYGARTAAMRQELDAIPAESEGAALTRVQIEAATAPDVPFRRWTCADDFKNLPRDDRERAARDWCRATLGADLAGLNARRDHALGGDFARSGDASSFMLFEVGADLVRRAALVVELRNVPFEQQRDVLFHLLDRVPRFVKGALDATGNGAYLAEVAAQRYGDRIVEVKFSSDWYRQEMPPYVSGISDGSVVLPAQADVVSDHQALQFVDGLIRIPKDFRFKGSDGFDRHGDTAVAGALGFHASRQDTSAYGYETFENRADLDGWGDDDPFGDAAPGGRRSETMW